LLIANGYHGNLLTGIGQIRRENLHHRLGGVMRTTFDQDQLRLWLLLLLPAVFYLRIVNANSVNIPYWDDYRNILMPMNQIMETSDLKSAAHFFLQPTASHIPAVTRSVAWLQIKLTGHINFRWGVILGNLGLVASVYLLVVYLHLRQNFPLDTLPPVPFLLFSITHWFAMHFMDPAWQFYWGSTLFPLLVFIAILEQRYILASIAFAAAIFTSSGSIALYPLIVLFCLSKRDWRSAAGFGLVAGLFFVLFYCLDQHDPSISERKILHFNIWIFCRYVGDFIGSLIPDIHWNSQYIQPQHYVAGLIIISAGLYGTWRFKGMALLKLVFIYTMILPCMAYYLRAGKYPFVPSRYSLFSLMATMSISMMFMGHWVSKNDKWIAAKAKLLTVAAILIWIFSILQCEIPLLQIKNIKFHAIQRYLASGDPDTLIKMTPDIDLTVRELDKAKKLGIFSLEPVDDGKPD
jgi:hypothetical protein